MIEVLHPLQRDTCAHCGGPITLMRGDLTGPQWYHNGSPGRRECPGTTYATPAPPSTGTQGPDGE